MYPGVNLRVYPGCKSTGVSWCKSTDVSEVVLFLGVNLRMYPGCILGVNLRVLVIHFAPDKTVFLLFPGEDCGVERGAGCGVDEGGACGVLIARCVGQMESDVRGGRRGKTPHHSRIFY